MTTFHKALLATAAVLAAVAVFLLATMPPAPIVIAGTSPDELSSRIVAGAYHVHSTVSDGVADRAAIAAAAARAELRFVVFTDHGDGTRVPDPPAYLHGVLCVDGVEISTNGGHYVGLDMRRSPYPLGGEAEAVVEDVRRLGGFGIVAHPESPKEGLHWTDWSPPVDGMEWLNADSEWRDEPRTRLLRVPFDYLVRPGPALASILDRPGALERWDALAATRPVVGLAGHDAHGGLTGRQEGAAGPPLPRFPSYEASFRSFTTRAILSAAFTGNPAADGRMLLEAIRHGRVFTAIDALAGPAWLDFRASRGTTEVVMGQTVLFDGGVSLHARGAIPPGGSMVLLCNGREVTATTTDALTMDMSEPGACRVEVRQPPGSRAAVPWLVSNPIYLLPGIAEPVGAEPLFESVRALERLDWTIERDAGSLGTATPHSNGFQLEYRLRGDVRSSQYVAAVARLHPPLPEYDRILFTASAAAPMRLSVQVRFHELGGARWARSVYLSPMARRVSLAVSELVSADGATTPVDFRQADSLLFVIDLTNARPGDAGQVDVWDLSLARAVPDR